MNEKVPPSKNIQVKVTMGKIERFLIYKVMSTTEKLLNGRFPSSLEPPFQSESKCDTILMKITLICMKMKLHAELIFRRMISHLDSF